MKLCIRTAAWGENLIAPALHFGCKTAPLGHVAPETLAACNSEKRENGFSAVGAGMVLVDQAKRGRWLIQGPLLVWLLQCEAAPGSAGKKRL